MHIKFVRLPFCQLAASYVTDVGTMRQCSIMRDHRIKYKRIEREFWKESAFELWREDSLSVNFYMPN